MGFSRQEYWSGLPFPSPKKSKDWAKSGEHYGSLSAMTRASERWRHNGQCPGPLVLRPHGFVHSTLPSAVDTLSLQCRELEKKGFSGQSESTLSFLVVIQGFTTSGNPLIYYFLSSKQIGSHTMHFILFLLRHMNQFFTSAWVSWKATGAPKIHTAEHEWAALYSHGGAGCRGKVSWLQG